MSGATTETIAVQGAQRTYRRYLPGGDDRPLPVVINLHGLTSNIDQQVVISAFEPLAARETFIVLTPQAAGTPAGWNLTENAANLDVQFITSMLDEMEATACVDTARVYVEGISDGGIMSSILACLLGDRIAAVGLVSGIKGPGSCPRSRAMPVVIFWGKEDRVLPYCGGLGNIVAALLTNQPIPTPSAPMCPPANLYGFPPVEQVVDDWATADGCDPNPDIVHVAADVEERDFAGCVQSSAVRFTVVTDGGHTWPGSKVMEAISNTAASAIIGFTTDAIDATQQMWEFFKAHALTGGTG